MRTEIKRKRWTKSEVLLLKAIYPYYPNYVLAKVFKRSETAIRFKARSLGLRKEKRGRLPKYIKAYYDRILLTYIFERLHNNEHGGDI